MTAAFQNWGMAYGWAWFLATVIGILVIALPLMLAVAMIIYAERKIWAAIALRRRAQGVPQGDHHPDQREQGVIPDRADRHLHRGAHRVGRGPVRARRGAR